MQEIFKKLNKPQTYLLLANVLLVFFLILLANVGVLPLKNLGDFLFFSLIFLFFSLYRPSWSFLFFVGMIALENINLAPDVLGFSVRPYQFFAGLALVAVIIRLAAGRLNFKLPKFSRIDIAVLLFAAAGFVSAIFAFDKSLALKQSVIAASFTAIYFLARIFIQNLDDLKKITPFFLSSSIVVVIYGIWQNILFLHGENSFESMPGRSNATFTEPDWLGIFLVLFIAVIYTLLHYFQRAPESKTSLIFNVQFSISNQFPNFEFKIFKPILFLLLISGYVLLVLTVSRSAWLGASVMTIVFLILVFFKDFRENQWKRFLNLIIFIASAAVVSLFLVYIFHLTNFQLFNRVSSTGSGLQKITVSCNLEVRLPNEINSTNELEKYGCRHINLEEIEAEKAKGNFVTEIYRTDPNINIRSVIYQKSWEEIKTHPIFGLGWGNIGNILGRDERGAILNSSNIFFETWLGAGILGLVALAIIWVYILTKGIKLFLNNNPGGVSLGLFLFLGAVSLIIPNLFNAGIMLGILWLFFGINFTNHKS